MNGSTAPAALALALLLAACSSPSEEGTDQHLGAEDTATFRVAFLLLDGVYNTELTAPFDVLHHAQGHAERPFEVYTVGRDLDPVRSYEGLRIQPDWTLDDAPWPTVVVVPSGAHSMDDDAEDARVLDWLREAFRRADWTVSVCDGAFLLAAAGILEDRTCTTYLGDADELQRRNPGLDVRQGRGGEGLEECAAPLFVVDGTTITGQGGARSFEPAMWLIERLFGAECATAVATGMVLDWPLPPGSYLVVEESARE